MPPKQSTLRKQGSLIGILALIVFHWLLLQGYEQVHGVIARPLWPCDVSWFENKGRLLVLGCPHTDAIKLWPLPIQQPRFEDLPVRQGEVVF